jgi:hypothetical protein
VPSIDPFLSRTRKPGYNCLDFVREVWLGLFGDDVRARLDALCASVHGPANQIALSGVRGFKKLTRPESPCFVVMQRSKVEPHIGIYLNGRILHLADRAVEFQPVQVACRYFTRIGYYL